ncbi:MAG: malto-oligosyltrehalose trehalohydrolase [Clostridiales bacterium]|nr:malto-oligosyltrehalose trehalohydrolase [Clostridiales bacterium]MCF8021878.1 malto-oligosyltrehalose trehalohydrolase [Clostridiales bacterium]
MLKMGANIIDRKNNKIEFRVFAYNKQQVSVIISSKEGQKEFLMQQEKPHVYSSVIECPELTPLYKFKIDGDKDYPDPYSNFQPYGVHGFSRVIDHGTYQWQNTYWEGKDLEELITMEIHVGTFSNEGTLKGLVNKLGYLSELGINAVELMPVTQTPGRWNWGYDGANLFSVNHNYGAPDDLKYLVDQCHKYGIAVILDVVYNHFSPEGNYLHAYGPYFTEKHKTPWGAAVNFDDELSEYTRKMVLDNVHYWLEIYHLDGLRLDAVHAIKDNSNPHILQEINETTKKIARSQDRKKFVIAESDQNNVWLINPVKEGGCGIDAQWMDDFHHCIHTALTGERQGYYMDYGCFKDFEKVFKNYLYTGEFSNFMEKKRGTDASQNPGKQFVVAVQNHDQVGNRARGDRLSTLVELSYLKAAAGLMFFSAYLPLVFMGEEYGEKRPFLFFTDYQDEELKQAVSKGRREEFKDFEWEEILVIDPQDPESFYRSKLLPATWFKEKNNLMLNFYKDIINLRKTHPVLKALNKSNLEVNADSENKVVTITRWNSQKKLTAFFNLGNSEISMTTCTGIEIFNSKWERYSRQKNKYTSKLQPGQMVILENNLSSGM